MSEYDHEPSIMRRTWPTMGCSAMGGGETCPTGIATRLGVGRFGVWIPAGTKSFLFSKISQIDSGVHPVTYAMGTGAFSRECTAAGA